MNHFGPLRINSGGKSGGRATAIKIVHAIHRNVQPRDGVILLGTFNTQVNSRTVRQLERYLPKVWTGQVYDGIDHCFSPLSVDSAQNLGKAGSDHDAMVLNFML